MEVEIVLYKTKFDNENIFVGTDKKSRQDILNSIPNTKTITGSYNPLSPFRITGNYLEFVDKYNYMKYDLYTNLNGTKQTITRFYFIHDFVFVNDSCTDILIEEDIIGRLFHDFKFSRILPEKYTYKQAVLDRKFTPLKTTDIFNVIKENDLLVRCDNDVNKILGMLVVTCTTQNGVYDEGGRYGNSSDNPNVHTGGLRLKCVNFLLPFVFKKDEFSENIDTYGNYTINGLGVSSVNNFDMLSASTLAGHSIIASSIIFNLKGMFTFSFNSAGTGTYSILSTDGIGKITQENMPTASSSANFARVSLNRLSPVEIAEIEINDYSKYPYEKVEIWLNGNKYEIDKMIFKKGVVNKITAVQSFVPPYNLVIDYTAKETNNNHIRQFSASPFLTISNASMFMQLNEAYADWYKSNYNSTVSGLAVKHEYQWKQNAVDESVSFASSVFSTDWISGLMKAGKSSLNALGKNLNTINNQEKENKLLNLKLQDIRNTPDNVSFNGSISQYFKTQFYLRIIHFENLALSEMKKNHTAYGFESFIEISNIKSHSIFDYIRAVDIIFSNSEMFLSEADRKNIERFFNNGVRLWYDYNNFKNFTIENKEV